MGVLGKMEAIVDIKSSGDVFHELYSCKPHHISNITPHKIHGCDVHEGEYGQPGCVVVWDYTIDGVKHSSKVIVEAIDEEKLVRFKNIEGSLLEEYKSFISTMQVINKGEITTVKWTLEFEKLDDYGPYPTKVMDFVIGMTRDVEAHHLNEKEN